MVTSKVLVVVPPPLVTRVVTSKVGAVAAVSFDEPSSLGGPAKISRDNVVRRNQSEKKRRIK